ncbi:hypothetical protein [Sphingomonas sp. PP-CE-1G-424]|jgi:hypothetical protein|uniref:hypothetical protein n=1 Tax=Sphingomonas sp. PP-CE-1G-424 TaxID=2135658 RepID=UPI0010546B79|nr:hypothetical protein [Sphingomonas sp. PP-CE-1G-424]TCP64268.1 hypothetical protein C8J43_1216 [Sphingomonas sp. PP-CE-1G-424]
MTGVDIIGELLLDHAPLIELIAAESIQSGALPEQVVLPALLVRLVSNVERQMLKRSGTVRTIDRVSVTVRADKYADQGEAIRLAVKACAGRTGSYAGATNVSVLTAGRGPDARGPGNSFEQAQDFRVSFDAPA